MKLNGRRAGSGLDRASTVLLASLEPAGQAMVLFKAKSKDARLAPKKYECSGYLSRETAGEARSGELPDR